jgi:glycosyltransferase involved in cell wall biosynthesis
LTERPLVSIVTPTLQRATHLEGTLRSVRGQTYPLVEHIVVDGRSTDGTIELLERYAGTYDLRWISEPDRGMYDAINKGLRMARGQILAYLNSDDLYLPWTIEAFVAALAAHSDAGLAYGDAIRLDEIASRVIPVFQAPVDASAVASFGSLIQPAVAMRREVFEALGDFDDGLRYVADLEYWLRAAPRFRFHRIPEFLAVEKRHAGMLSVASRDAMAAEEAAMRGRFRGGLGGSSLGRLLGRARIHLWLGWYWLRFVAATRGLGDGWSRTREACRPSVRPGNAVAGLFPSRGGRLRSSVRWARDPLSVAIGRAADPDDSGAPNP